MANEAAHIQITEFTKEVFPKINWMLEDLFCQYGVAMPYFILEYDFPDYSERPEWASGYYYNLEWGDWGYYLPWFNQLLWLLFDAADLPRWTMPDFSPWSWDMFNSQISQLYEGAAWTEIARETGNNYITRTGLSGVSYNAAKTDYENAPSYAVVEQGSYNGYLGWYNYRGTGGVTYQVIGINGYLAFDTSGVSSVTGAKLVFSGSEIQLSSVSENPVVYIYEHDYGTLESGDWTGGTKIAEVELSPGVSQYSVEIDTSYVNTGVTSRYRFALKKTVNSSYWAIPFPSDEGDWKGQIILVSTVKLAYK